MYICLTCLGGRSVSVLMLSDLASGLFRRAISESGVATNPSGIWSPPRFRHYIQANARKLGERQHIKFISVTFRYDLQSLKSSIRL